ncbi:MAG: hypothetical protein IJ057_07965 [Bacteroidales bacterium]|nr:hypothetical protein [Bacteroidales bacterium]
MKRLAFLAVLSLSLFGFCGKASAQFLPDVPDMKGKTVFGGNFGFGMNGNYLSLSLAPQVGYRILSPWEVGVRGIYDLTCNFNRVYGNSYGHYFGVAPYTNFQIYKGVFVHAEDEVMYGIQRWNHQTVAKNWYNSVFVGAGYRQYSATGSFVYFLVLYNLNWATIPSSSGWDTPYMSPIQLRVGYCF